ncbi:cytochrome c biogenesis protein CcdA [Clostridium sp. 19966]|uniref:cytochrome c biogenesis CcdA family protein n=1 Tax=Clostridium sp. 19966 TaxID=2768166 RepID=UPI0028DD7137|nr:cytochrome c biogenesis protein CcdA [Clostridium sp. 19966]MDT8718648.1 cytochrome c biogenesis protein CcdA [Clostridium sp. 19966]
MNNVSFIVAFSAGLLSFLSPCVLPLIPAYISYLTESALSETGSCDKKKRTLNKAFGFVLGFSIIFILMGATVTFLGKVLLVNQHWLRKVGGALIFLFGLHTIGLFKIKLFYREKRFFKFSITADDFNPIAMGMAFAGGWTPCVGPILSSILIYAGNMDTVNKGILLLIFYSLGLAIPFILSAIAVESLTVCIRRYSRFIPIVSIFSGVLILIMGVMVFTNKINILSGYLKFLNFY